MKKMMLYNDQYSFFGKKAKKWLEEHQVEFEEKDVSLAKNLEELFACSGQYAVPVIVADEEVILGFDEKKLEKILK